MPLIELVCGEQWQEILSTAVREGDTPAAAVPINVEGCQHNFHCPEEPSAGGAAGPSASAGGGRPAVSTAIWDLSPGAILGLTSVSAAVVAQFAAKEGAGAGCEMQNCSRRAKTAILNSYSAVSNIDPGKLFAALKEAYPLQKCLLACPPSQSDC